MDNLLENPRAVKEQGFPKEGTSKEKLIFLIHYAVLAPSGYNTQPWLFRLIDDRLLLYADRTRALPVIDPDDRTLVMSCGAALFNLRIAIRHFHLTPVVHVFPDASDADLLAEIQLGRVREATQLEHNLFKAIHKRRTNRKPFKSRPIPEKDLTALQHAVAVEGARLHVLNEPHEKNKLAARIAEGDRLQGANKHFRRELASWIHPNRSRRREGLPGYAMGAGTLESMVVPLLVRTFDWGKGKAANNAQIAEGSPVLAVLTTAEDTPVGWLQAGQALANLLLLATHFGISASFLNQPIEVPDLRGDVAMMTGYAAHPQLILRMGFGPQPRPTPRRALEEVLMAE